MEPIDSMEPTEQVESKEEAFFKSAKDEYVFMGGVLIFSSFMIWLMMTVFHTMQ